MIDTIYANVAAARLELSEVKNPSVQVRDALKRLADVLDLIGKSHASAARDDWIEKEAMRDYATSIPADTHNLHCRAWSELSAAEQDVLRAKARAEWDQD